MGYNNKNNVHIRALPDATSTVDKASRTVLLTFSTEKPVETYMGMEVLSHASGAMRVGERQANMPLLFNHNPDDILGIVEKIYTQNNQGKAVVRFGKDARGEWAMNQVIDGVLKQASVMYRIYEAQTTPNPADTDEDMGGTAANPDPDKDGDNDIPTIMVSDWEPFEISIVSIPADERCLIGRGYNSNTAAQTQKGKRMNTTKEAKKEQEQPSESLQPKISVSVKEDFVAQERNRSAEIMAMAEKYSISAEQRNKWIDNGTPVEQIKEILLDRAAQRANSVETAAYKPPMLTPKESKQFSIFRGALAMANGTWHSEKSFEREVSEEVARKFGLKELRGMAIDPNDPSFGLRAYDYGTGQASGVVTTTSGNLIQTTLLASSFIDALRPASRVIGAGAQILGGLQQNIDIPRQATVSQAQWGNETVDAVQTSGTFDKVSLAPKTLSAQTMITRTMLTQGTPDMESIVRKDLTMSMGTAIDQAALYGGGGSTPRGIANTANINSVALGANGRSLVYNDIVDIITSLGSANMILDPTQMAFIVNSKTLAQIMKLADSSGRPLWLNYAADKFLPEVSMTPTGSILGYPIYVSNNARSNLTKGTGTGLSEMFFGRFSDLIIGQWGAFEVVANPWGATFASGGIQVRAIQLLDMGVRLPKAFSYVNDIVA